MKQHAPTIWELQTEYPRLIRAIISNPESPQKSLALLDVPYAGDILAMLRKIPGAHWSAKDKAWRVPQYSARRLADALYVIATRSR